MGVTDEAWKSSPEWIAADAQQATAAAFDQNQRRRLVRLAQDLPETVRADSRGAVLEGDPMKDQDLANLRILDAISHDAALEAAEHGAMSPELRADVNAIGDVVRARIAEQLRRDLASAALRPLAAAVARPSILAMTRDALVARLAELRAMHANVILAHRDFAMMTDSDLRVALEDAELALAQSGG